ncbi:hypothetical protein [Sorangium sp. So ce426]|uniref:hypothetical protein n=1 Tax=Sorangium sp. So ce426 TaxID=3133312 RepID=UPI003F5B2FE6
MRAHLFILPMLAAWLLPQNARAASQETYDVFQIAQKSIAGPTFADVFKRLAGAVATDVDFWIKAENGGVVTKEEHCKVNVDKASIKPSAGGLDDCPLLWRSQRPDDQLTLSFVGPSPNLDKTAPASFNPDATIVLKHRPRSGNGTKLSLADENGDSLKVASGAPAAQGQVAFVVDVGGKREWRIVPTQGDKLALPIELKGAQAITGFADFDGSGYAGYAEFQIDNKDEQSPPTAGGVPLELEDTFCNKKDRNQETVLICVDLVTDGDRPVFQFEPDTSQIIRPNRAVLVRVRHLREKKVNITMDGERGLFQPGIRTEFSEKAGQERAQADLKGGGGKSQKSIDVVSESTFGPRRPGKADIKIKHLDGAENPTYTVELLVEQTYVGAVRLGLGPVFTGAVDRVYEASTRPGSQQPEIVARSSGNVDVELVLGFAPFVFDYLADGGRSAIRGCGTCVAPYVGIGLLNQSATSLELLKSLHLGLEWEFSPSFSLAGTVVLRRVTRLAPGYEVGSPVDAGSVPTTERYGVGGGLVFNFSPEFLQVATRSSATFFK